LGYLKVDELDDKLMDCQRLWVSFIISKRLHHRSSVVIRAKTELNATDFRLVFVTEVAMGAGVFFFF